MVRQSKPVQFGIVAAGLVVPLHWATSPIVRVGVRGSLPPPSSGLPPMTAADITTLVPSPSTARENESPQRGEPGSRYAGHLDFLFHARRADDS